MKIAILIKTYDREACLLNTLDSIAAFCDVPYRLYIADDGPISGTKRSRYDQLAREGHVILYFDRPTAVTGARNALTQQVEDEEFILRIDDDFEFFEETNLRAMLAVMRADPAIGVVADIEIQCGDGKGVKDGEYSPNQGFLEIRGNVLYKSLVPVSAWQWRTAGKHRYAYADHTRNFLLIRRSCIRACPWDERIFIEREHVDFLLSVSLAGWKIAFTPDSAHKHRDDLAVRHADEEYRLLRKTQPVSHSGVDVLYEKWGISEIKSIKGEGAIAEEAKRNASLRSATASGEQALAHRLSYGLPRRARKIMNWLTRVRRG